MHAILYLQSLGGSTPPPILLQQDAACDIGEHPGSAPLLGLPGLGLVVPPGGQNAGVQLRRSGGPGELVPVGEPIVGLVPHRHPPVAGA